MIWSVKLAAVVLVGLTLTASQDSSGAPIIVGSAMKISPHPIGNAGSSPSFSTSPINKRSPTTHGAQTAVEGRDYTTLSIIDSKGVSGARISILTMLDNGRTVISNNPPGAHGQLIAQTQVGIQ